MLADLIELYSQLFSNSSLAVSLLTPDDLSVAWANLCMLDLFGQSPSVFGMPLTVFFPDLLTKLFPDLIAQAIRNGGQYTEHHLKLDFRSQGISKVVFLNLNVSIVQSIKLKTRAILIMAFDVTKYKQQALTGQENERMIQALIAQAPVAMCLFRGGNFSIELVNAHMQLLWARNQYLGLKQLNYVYATGMPYTHQFEGISYVYTPLFDPSGGTNAIVLMACPAEMSN